MEKTYTNQELLDKLNDPNFKLTDLEIKLDVKTAKEAGIEFYDEKSYCREAFLAIIQASMEKMNAETSSMSVSFEEMQATVGARFSLRKGRFKWRVFGIEDAVLAGVRGKWRWFWSEPITPERTWRLVKGILKELSALVDWYFDPRERKEMVDFVLKHLHCNTIKPKETVA